MCDRKARKKGTALPPQFWKSPTWEKEFKLQVRHALALLRLYSVPAIVAALRTPKGKTLYSLGSKFIEPLVIIEHKRIQKEKAKQEERVAERSPEEPTPPVGPEQPRPAFVRKDSVLSKLRNL